MKVFGIIGWPVSHSLSPAMHNAAFKALGVKAVYGLLPVAPEALKEAVSGLKALGIAGVSVTIPHKEAVLPLLDEASETARRIGAVNTILNREGRLYGTNTDWLGALKALEEKTTLPGKRAVVVGAGGSARAICFALKEAGADIFVYNRTLSRAEELAAHFGGKAFSLAEISRAEGDILIQTTSVGLQEDKSPVPKEVLSRFEVVMDLVYQPLKTRLLREAEEAGCKIVDGLSMLVYQGAEQFRLWTGLEPPLAIMREAAENELRGERNGNQKDRATQEAG